MTPEEKTKAIVAQSIDKAQDDIAALDAEGVAAVRAAEVAGQNRSGFIALLDARDQAIAEGAVDAKLKADAKAKDSPKPWQAPDYSGPMTAAQAEWRQHNIKPAKAITK